jgi:hypothetical protein
MLCRRRWRALHALPVSVCPKYALLLCKYDPVIPDITADGRSAAPVRPDVTAQNSKVYLAHDQRGTFCFEDSMSVHTPKASDAKSALRPVTIAVEKNAPLRIVKELLKNTGLLAVEGNFEFLDFVADCPSPLAMWTGGCKFRVPPAPSVEEEPKPTPHLTVSLDKEVC